MPTPTNRIGAVRISMKPTIRGRFCSLKNPECPENRLEHERHFAFSIDGNQSLCAPLQVLAKDNFYKVAPTILPHSDFGTLNATALPLWRYLGDCADILCNERGLSRDPIKRTGEGKCWKSLDLSGLVLSIE
jgi:hypothetical protein